MFNLHSVLAECSNRLDTPQLLLLLSGKGKAPLLNALLLTSIMTAG